MPPVMMTLEHILPIGAVITLLTVECGRILFFVVPTFVPLLMSSEVMPSDVIGLDRIGYGWIST
jgi:hypothetical protein